MKFYLKLIVVIAVLILVTGCTQASVDEKEETKIIEDVINQEEATEAQIELRESFLDYVKSSPGLVNVRAYVLEHIMEADTELADDMVYELIAHAKFDVYEEIDVVFLEENIGLHNYLYNIEKQHEGEFELTTAFIGSDKTLLLEISENEAYNILLSDLFGQGYGLILSEGAYYPTIDYNTMLTDYGVYISPMLYEYLSILSDDLAKPTLTGDYLAISPDELMNRAVRAEQFLIDYPDMIKQFRQDIGQVLVACIWKLSGPTPFDGMLTERYKLSKDISKVYKTILKDEPSPIVTSTVKELMTWVDEQEGQVLGSENDLNATFEKYNEIFSSALEQMDELYPMK